MKQFDVPKKLKEVGELFARNGFSAYIVGGAVRDYFLHIRSSDWDIATNATPQEVQKIFYKTIPTGIAHGTVTILYKGEQIECTTFRAETNYSDGRHPDEVLYADTIEEDLSRRDFTVNAIAVEILSGTIVDPFDGRKAIKQKRIETVGNPDERFTEDGLRLLRAVRFACRLNFELAEETRIALKRQRQRLASVSQERVRDELVKMLASDKPSRGFRLLEEAEILPMIMPELTACRGVEQGGLHSFDVFDHSIIACDAAPKDNATVRLAALFHDFGKVATKAPKEGGGFSFHGHQQVSGVLTREIMRRLKFPQKNIERVAHLVEQHMFHYDSSQTDAAIRRFIVRVGRENIEDLFALRIADVYGLAGKAAEPTLLAEFGDRISKVLKEDAAFSLKDLAVDGKDLMEIGIPHGKVIGIVLNALFETVLDDPSENSRENLLAIARAFYKKLQQI